MIHLLRRVDGVEETYGYVPPGDLCVVKAADQIAGVVAVFGCFKDDTGGQLHAADFEAIQQAQMRQGDLSQLLGEQTLKQTIAFHAEITLDLVAGSTPSGVLVARHIPASWN